MRIISYSTKVFTALYGCANIKHSQVHILSLPSSMVASFRKGQKAKN